ncbi:hypothetical protein TNIN_347441 [Trichonephila inaurata madagascariensis]|uniref:Uncharacterized protein n=1 Tax=Trichonephila inaurata madagascariensis TaxID=2747483 RepID=A0A8X7C3U1_9ARAC|nr:hypothetical protein TNIN_347441 [Trichonephila inaurata madagascariensis]
MPLLRGESEQIPRKRKPRKLRFLKPEMEPRNLEKLASFQFDKKEFCSELEVAYTTLQWLEKFLWPNYENVSLFLDKLYRSKNNVLIFTMC